MWSKATKRKTCLRQATGESRAELPLEEAPLPSPLVSAAGREAIHSGRAQNRSPPSKCLLLERGRLCPVASWD